MAVDFRPAVLQAGCSFEDFCRTYARTQAVLVKACVNVDKRPFGLHQLSHVYKLWPDMVSQTFSFEHGAEEALTQLRRKAKDAGSAGSDHTAAAVLGDQARPGGAWYASFVVKQPKALQHLFAQLPETMPPFLRCRRAPKLPAKRKRNRMLLRCKRLSVKAKQVVSQSQSIWLFFGRNPNKKAMPGRPPHTDKMRHHGTWHVQVSGSKVWHLRATSELLESAGVPFSEDDEHPRHAVKCEAGDVLVVNTRLWWHSTKLPSLLQTPGHNLSLSYARDFVFSEQASGSAAAARVAASTAQSDEEDDVEEQYTGMGDVNVDGMLAKRRYQKGAVIMSASEMPQREQSVMVPERPNCMVRDLPDGSEALVAVRDISSGELFLVLGYESDEEDPQRMHMRTFVL